MLQKWLTWLSSRMLHDRFLFASSPYILDLLMAAKDFKALVLHISELQIGLPKIPHNSPQSRIALVIKKAIKTPKLNTYWLEVLAKVLNMLIGLKANNYYSKVFKRVNYKLWNSTFWVVITPPNRHIASPLAMKERKIKIKITIIYNIMLITSKNFKWHDDLTLTWNIKEI